MTEGSFSITSAFVHEHDMAKQRNTLTTIMTTSRTARMMQSSLSENWDALAPSKPATVDRRK
jgi:hypothetical protein